MKIKLVIFSLLCASRLTAAEHNISELTVTNSLGDKFTNLTLNKATSDGLLFDHKSGLVKAKWSQLPDWCKAEYGSAGEAQTQKEIEAGKTSAAQANWKDQRLAVKQKEDAALRAAWQDKEDRRLKAEQRRNQSDSDKKAREDDFKKAHPPEPLHYWIQYPVKNR